MNMNDIRWRKSTYSSSNGGACIEVAAADRAVAVRDSKDTGGPVLAFGQRRSKRPRRPRTQSTKGHPRGPRGARCVPPLAAAGDRVQTQGPGKVV
jgi:hypothetical protein